MRPVVAHDLADDARWIETRRGGKRRPPPRYDRRGPERPPGLATSGKTWPGDTSASGPCDAIDGDGDGSRAVGGADPGEMPSRASIETVKAVSLRLRLVLRHRLQTERVGAVLGQREADQAAAVPRHEVDRLGRGHLRRDDEVALILAVVVVDQDEHPAVARLVDDRSAPTRTSVVPRWISFSSRSSVSAVGFQSPEPSLRRQLG